MAEYLQIPIQMTSNNTPEPFLIDNVVNNVCSGYNNSQITDAYKMFDNNINTNYLIGHSSSVSFNITLNAKVKINKISIQYTTDNRSYIISFLIYGIDDNNTETLISSQGQSKGGLSPFDISLEDNKTFYKKYKIIISCSSFGPNIYIQEIQLFINDSQNHILFNKNYFGFNDNDLISFDDITQYSKYSFCLYNLSDNIDKLKNHYPFRMMKLINK